MDLTWSAAEQEFRAEARQWLEANAPVGLPSGDTRAGFAAHLDWEKKLFDARWAVVSWPERYGGRDASLWEWLIFEEEYYRAGGPARVTQNGIFLLAPAVFSFGTEAQRDRILPRMAAAEELWCQGWSEPGAGSDLAAISSRATPAPGGWRLDGQKTWTTRGAFSPWTRRGSLSAASAAWTATRASPRSSSTTSLFLTTLYWGASAPVGR
jgi:alkylation response protein AidB-like acyl-CoA dehydrogenase